MITRKPSAHEEPESQEKSKLEENNNKKEAHQKLSEGLWGPSAKSAEKPVGTNDSANAASPEQIQKLNLPKAADLNVPRGVDYVNPCQTHMPCLSVDFISNDKALNQIPERKGNDAIRIEDYGIQTTKDGEKILADKTFWFTPEDGKIYLQHGSQVQELQPQITHTDRSGGLTLKYPDGTVIEKLADFSQSDNPGYTFHTTSGYDITLYTDKNKQPKSSYHGLDIDEYKKSVAISPLSGGELK